MRKTYSNPKFGLVCNEKIRASHVRINTDGESRIISKLEAIAMAVDQNKDLVVISDKSDPPVCKIVDLNKFLYEKKQRAKEAAKKARANTIETKEIRMTLNIGQNDINVKIAKVQKFLEKKCKVTLTVTLKGRERGKQDLARQLLKEIADQMEVELEPFAANPGRVSARIK